MHGVDIVIFLLQYHTMLLIAYIWTGAGFELVQLFWRLLGFGGPEPVVCGMGKPI